SPGLIIYFNTNLDLSWFREEIRPDEIFLYRIHTIEARNATGPNLGRGRSRPACLPIDIHFIPPVKQVEDPDKETEVDRPKLHILECAQIGRVVLWPTPAVFRDNPCSILAPEFSLAQRRSIRKPRAIPTN